MAASRWAPLWPPACWAPGDNTSADCGATSLAVVPPWWWRMAVAGAVGTVFERFIVRPVYGQHLKQILITMGGMIIGEELIKVIWGPAQIPVAIAQGMRGSRCWWRCCHRKIPPSVAMAVGVMVFGVPGLDAVAHQGRPADPRWVRDREMVESLGYRIRRLFVGVFVVGSALAGPGRRDVGPVTSTWCPRWARRSTC